MARWTAFPDDATASTHDLAPLQPQWAQLDAEAAACEPMDATRRLDVEMAQAELES
ncbi:MAG: hypothetical protein KatS3mg122_0093 [Caldimonas sp.]|uniref:hypothetical protein n=1 Tax=Caldimonas taiwanensis TaxID=307483 RepID=UPI0012FAE258|nr:hypothetical protein [Caldimonas taiwanensis]GIX22862.1 MAG: hypothetical protein KatS3mg122_0093 [Caldimonas sp.]